MDEMELWETYPLIDNLGYTDASNWEQTRLLITMLANMFSKTKVKATEILPLPWDKKTEQKTTGITTEEIQELKQKAEIIKQKNYGNNTNKIDE